MSWLDKLIAITFQSAGTSVGTRQTLNFTGATVTDDPTNNRVNVAITDTGMTALTGDVTASGSGSVATTVAKLNSQLASAYVKTDASKNVTTSTTVPYSDIANTAGAAGDMLVGNASNQFDQLAIGALGTVLWSNGSKPGWVNNPTLTSLTLSGLTASKYVVTDGLKALASQTGVPRGDVVNTGGATGDLLVGNGTALDRLAIGSAGQVLTVSGGTPAWAAVPSGAGAYNPVDAATTHWYKLNEASGNLANSITGAANPLVPSPESSFLYQDPNLYSRGTYAVRCLAAGTNDGLNATGMSVSFAAGGTLECVLGFLDYIPATSATAIVEICNSTRSNGLLQFAYDLNSSPGHIRATIASGASASSSVSSYKPGGRIHLAAVFNNVDNKVTLWVNGIAMTASSAIGIGTTMANLTIGNNTSGGAPYRGLIADVRVTPAKLTSAYFLAATKAMGAL